VQRSISDNLAVGSRRRIMFVDDTLYKFKETLRKADEQLEEEIKKMPVGVCE